MEFLRVVFRILSIGVCLGIYLGIWVSLVLNWERFMRTGYAYHCWESTAQKFYIFWIVLHIVVMLFGCIWAWS